MKKLAILVFSFLLIGITTKAASENAGNYIINRYDGKTYIFEEGGVEFSVFADGQFDFAYVGPRNSEQVYVSINTPGVNISFNAGHDYDMYVQYDDYGAVIQIEDVPIYYDGYGRITQAGNVDIQYNDRRIVRVGGLYVNYDHYGYYSGCTGYINVYNRFYVYRPWHVYYAPPIFASCVVYDYPYRRYYSPVRYSFSHHRNYYKRGYNNGYANARRDFYRPGSRIHRKDGRSIANRDYNPNRRNTMVADRGRGNNSNRSGRVSQDEGRRNQTSTERSAVRNPSETKGRPVTQNSTSREGKRNATANNSNRGGNSKGRPSTQNSSSREGKRNATAINNNRGGTSKGRPVSSRQGSVVKRNNNARPQQKRGEVAQNSRKTVNTRGTSRTSSNKTTTARSTNTKNNSSSRGSNSGSRGRTSKGGRG
jgi:hypothetical protein